MASIRVKALVIKIGGREAGIEARQKSVGAKIKNLTGDIHVISVQDSVHIAGQRQLGGEVGCLFADFQKELEHEPVAWLEIQEVMRAAIVELGLHVLAEA